MATLHYALFWHPDGSWYRLWMTHTEPRTERGHRWHVHATYDKSGTIAPIAGTKWFEHPYGMRNWDYNSEDEAVRSFLDRAQERLHKGYEIREGQVPIVDERLGSIEEAPG